MTEQPAERAIFLTEEQVVRLLPMPDAIEAVDRAFRALGRGEAVNRPRERVHIPGGTFHLMAASNQTQGFLGYKAYGGLPGGGAGMLVMLYSSDTGRLLAIMQANRLGQIRTGAASGVATRHLARSGTLKLGMIGTGFQARTQLAAVAAVRPLSEVRVYSRSAQHRAAFAQEMSAALDLAVRPVGSGEDSVRGAEVVNIITGSRVPVLQGAWLAPGAHVNAAGSNALVRQELDVETVRRASLIVADSVEQARIEAGDLLPAVESGVITWPQVRELADIVAGNVTGRTSPDDITLFESLGVALEDVAVAAVVYRRAVEQSIGTPLPF